MRIKRCWVFPLFLLCALLGQSVFSSEKEVDPPITEHKSTAGNPPKLYMYFPFDEGHGNSSKDEVGGLTAELHDIEWVDGISGKALKFNGRSSYAYVPGVARNHFLNSLNDPFTIEFWIKPDKSGKLRESPKEIINVGNSYGPGWRISWYYDCVEFMTGNGVPSGNGCWYIRQNPNQYPLLMDIFNHVVVTRDSSKTITMYINGKKACQSNHFEITHADYDMTIGAFDKGNSLFFSGVIDDFKIYEGCVTEKDIFMNSLGLNKFTSIVIDGNLDEPIWKTAVKQSDFFILGKGSVAPVRTTAYIASDDRYFYFAIECFEPEMSKLKNSVRENSLNVYNDDTVEIMLDGDGNGADYYHFLVNPSGFHGQRFCEQAGLVGTQWHNSYWFSAVKTYKDKWVAEIAIPFAILNRETIKGDSVKFNIARNRRAGGTLEESSICNGDYHKSAMFKKFPFSTGNNPWYNAWHVNAPSFTEMKQEYGKIATQLQIDIFNKSAQSIPAGSLKPYLFNKDGSMSEGMISGDTSMPPNTKKRLNIVFQLNSPGEYEFIMIGQTGKTSLLFNYPMKLDFVPLSLDVTTPFYRNTIFSSDDIKEIRAVAKIGLSKAELEGCDLSVCFKDGNGNVIALTDVHAPVSENLIALKIPDLKVGDYTISAKLRKGNAQIASVNETIRKLPPSKGNEVRFDEKLNIIINGKARLPILWWGTAEKKGIEKLMTTGADGFVRNYWDVDIDRILATLKENNGIFQMQPWGPDGYNNLIIGKKELTPEAKAAITAVVNKVKDHPAFFAWQLLDEPSIIPGLDVGVLNEFYKLIRELDPYHPIIINDTGVDLLPSVIDSQDIIMTDPYLLPKDSISGGLSFPMSHITEWLDIQKRAGKGKKPTGIVLQAYDNGVLERKNKRDYDYDYGRAPCFTEERAMTFVSIIHDVKILNYYIYSNLHFVNKEWTDDGHGTINFPDLRIGVPYIIKEIRALEDVILFGNEISSQKSGEDNVHISVKTYQGHTYGFAVNTKHKAVNQKIQVGENVKKLMVISEARTIEVNEGSFSDDFAPYGTHLYTDDPAFRDLTPLNKIESEIKTAGGKFSVPYKK